MPEVARDRETFFASWFFFLAFFPLLITRGFLAIPTLLLNTGEARIHILPCLHPFSQSSFDGGHSISFTFLMSGNPGMGLNHGAQCLIP